LGQIPCGPNPGQGKKFFFFSGLSVENV